MLEMVGHELEGLVHLSHKENTGAVRQPDFRAMRWIYNVAENRVDVSPTLRALLPIPAEGFWQNIDSFFIAIAGLAAGDLLAAHRQAMDSGGRVRVVHHTATHPAVETLGSFLSHDITCISDAEGNPVVLGLVSNHVFHDDVQAMEIGPGILSEAAFRTNLYDFLKSAPKTTGLSAAVCILSLDRFEQMNILLGRQVADELLDQVAVRLRERITAFMKQRSKDDDREIALCRIGGAQFALAMQGSLHMGEMRTFAEFLLVCFREPFIMLSQRLHLEGRIGIAAAKATERSPDKVMSRAALALSSGLKDAPGSYRIFDAQDAAVAQERVILDTDLREALSQDRLFIEYMPIVKMADSSIAGFEALLRWDHPDMGLLTPALFIPMAEESGAITDVGDWVLSHALFEFAELCCDLPPDVYLAVNVSSEQLRRGRLQETVLEQLVTSGLSENRLMLEVTESVVIEDFSHAKSVMDALRARGVRWSIDDFGTGFSALSYLNELPFDELKLDKRFVRALSDTVDESVPETLIKAVLDIARSHNVPTVAEGIETAQQERWVADLGCNLAQGYYYSAPMRADKLRRFIELFKPASLSQ